MSKLAQWVIVCSYNYKNKFHIFIDAQWFASGILLNVCEDKFPFENL